MAFTSGNDINILQGTDLTTVGAGAGNDRYVLTAATLTANQKITLSDTLGTNTLQLVGGLEIVSSKVANDAIQLTLNNGAVITVLGASTFSFQTGGDSLSGTGGVVQSFNDFVTLSLGATVPAAGAAPIDVGSVTVNPDGGTTGGGALPTYALTAAAAAVDEGATATFNLATTNVAAGTEVAYTITGIDAADLASGALTGKAVVAADGSAVISVALAADKATEGAETLTVTLDGPAISAASTVNDTSMAPTFMLTASADSVNEGVANTFTVTASEAVTADTTVTFQLKVDAAGDTAQAADFNAGSFNPVTATILAGQTTATFNLSTITNDGTEVSEKYTVEATVAGVSTPLTKQVTILDGAVGAGQTFALTTGVDVIPGLNGSNGNTVTSGNDTIIGSYDTNAATDNIGTLNVTDLIDGGQGADTLKLTIGKNFANANLPSISNVETVEISGAGTATVTLDTTSLSGLTSLNVTKVAGALDLTAASSTAVSVAGATAAVTVTGGSTQTVAVEQGTNNVVMEKGTNISVTNTKVTSGTVVIGTNAATTADHPTGTVTVQSSGKAFADAATGALGAITVNGGTVVTINQDAYAAGTVSGAAKTITQSAITVNGDANTTTVSVTQDAAATAVAGVTAVAGKNETSVATFTKLGTGDAITVNGLTFTAAKALTAEQVASAFANLTASDLQGNLSTANGVYALVNSALAFTTGAATGATVTFTSTTATDLGGITASAANAVDTDGTAGADIAAAAPTFVAVDGAAATAAVTAVAGVVGGKVVVAAGTDNKIATVTLDGYGATSTVNSTALTALNLANSASDVTVTNAAAGKTLALSLNKVGTSTANATVDLATNADYTTLNITTAGTDSYVALTADATALTVAGTNHVTLASNLTALQTVTVTGTAGANLTASGNNTITAVNTTGTTGTVTSDISTTATYAGGAGVDNVTVGATTKALTLGAGNDTATVSVAVGAGGSIDGGDGTADTLSMTAANAVTLSANATFEAGVSNFEKVKIAVATGADQAIDMANLDDISYVVSAGGLDTVAAVAEVQNILVTGPATGAVSFLGTAVATSAAADTAGATITKIVADKATIIAAWNLANTTLEIQDLADGAGDSIDVTYKTTEGDVAAIAASTSAGITFALSTETTKGVAAVTAADFDISNLASGGTLELTGLTGTDSSVVVKDSATGTADVLNLVLTSANAITNGAAAALTVSNVESFNITATDTAFDTTKGQTLDTHAFTLAATSATSITVTGNAGLTLTNTGNIKLTMIDGSAMTGKLTAATTNTTAAETIKGGTAADSLTGGAMADVLLGNDGNDTLTSGTGLNTLTGGAGTDKFVVGSASTNVNSYSTITDLARGETIQFAGAASFASSKVSLGATAVFQDFANASVVGNATNALSWFEWAGDTYIIQDVDPSTTAFVNGVDKIVKLTGVLDLSSASFNTTQGTIDWI